MHRTHLATVLALGVAACLGGGAVPAFAGQDASTSPPAGYVHVQSAAISAASEHQTVGSVSCPGKKVPLGGGVSIASSSLGDNINTSYPAGNGWIADVNIGPAATSFTVFVVCANKPKGYQVVASGSVTSPPGQSGASASCPGAKVPWSGGFYSASGSLGADAGSSYPSGPQTWQVLMNNSSGTTTSFITYAVCAARPHLYGQSYGTGTSNPSSEDLVTGTCGKGQVVVGGGGYSSSTSVYADLNSTEPYTNSQWRSYLNNNTNTSPAIKGYAICVGV